MLPSVARIRAKTLTCAGACLAALALDAAPVAVLALAFATAAVPAAAAFIGGAPLLRALAFLDRPTDRSADDEHRTAAPAEAWQPGR
ncbi:hypothetical protein [Dactylosporangium sp. CA-139066]|uniref:hypothetical protein n=1 Tax=Dactylosporangium sp. CA-139066 TaxID=3239930 RepID=UPI003D89B47B